MRILLVTGTIAEESVKRYSSEACEEIDVLALPVPVAAFINPKYAAKALKGRLDRLYDMILLPGHVQGDVTPVEEATGVKTFKGPVHAADIPAIIELLDKIELSKVTPASELVKDLMKKRSLEEINEVEKDWRNVLRDFGGLVIGKEGFEVAVGKGFSMRVIAEIVNAPTLGERDIQRRAVYFKERGADIVDLGMLANDPKPEKIKGMIKAVRTVVNLPISVDTLDPSEIIEAADSGADLVLSVDSGNLEEVADSLIDIPVVVLPSNMKEGKMPRGAEARVEALRCNMKHAQELGLNKLIADPVLDPPINPGLFESLIGYYLFRREDAKTPLLFGLGNVTELIDADSPGVNALLASIAYEVGANLLFIPEFSQKARGSVRESAKASKMMFLAGKRQTVPKDLGIDLLILKEKRRIEEPYNRGLEKETAVVDAVEAHSYEEDELGWFKIEVDRENGSIAAIHYPRNMDKPDLIVKDRRTLAIYRTIIEGGLVGKLDHAAYLGRELQKAEIALQIERSYVQEEDLFP